MTKKKSAAARAVVEQRTGERGQQGQCEERRDGETHADE
jgi:hypothetical protein